jgi:hypothetical protein
MMIVMSIKERLIHRPADELVDGFVARQHGLQRIGLGLDPKPILPLHIRLECVGRRLAGIHDYSIVFGVGDRSLARPESADKVIVP